MSIFQKIAYNNRMRHTRKLCRLYPFEADLDTVLFLMRPKTTYDDKHLARLLNGINLKSSIPTIISKLKLDGLIEPIKTQAASGIIEFSLYRLTDRGAVFRECNRYAVMAHNSAVVSRGQHNERRNTRLKLIFGAITLLSILLNVLYIFGVIEWHIVINIK